MNTKFKSTGIIFISALLLSCGSGKKHNMQNSDEIPLSQIDKVVVEQMQDIAKTYIYIDGNKYQPLEGDVDDRKLLLYFTNGVAFLGFTEPELKPDGTIRIKLKESGSSDNKQTAVLQGKGLKVSEKASATYIKGEVTDSLNHKKHSIEILLNESVIGSGTTRLIIEKNRAILTGVLGVLTYVQIKNLIKNHPEINTLVLQDVPGSMNDPVNMHTGRLIRKAGYKIVVPANSEVASGGVDLFCSGKERIAEPGARLGVHSWYYNGISADDLPEDSPAHLAQIHYFTEMLGEKGRDFYFYTLRAAHSDGIHWMTKDELKEWGLITE